MFVAAMLVCMALFSIFEKTGDASPKREPGSPHN